MKPKERKLIQILITIVVLTVCVTEAVGQPGGRRGFRGFGEGPVKRLSPEELKFEDGVAVIPDLKTFEKLSYKGPDVMIDAHLADQRFVKFQVEKVGTDNPQMYFMNTKTHRAHMMFMRVAGLAMTRQGTMRGVLIYHPRLKTPAGDPGLFTYEFEPFD